jgi:hypothetical protein
MSRSRLINVVGAVLVVASCQEAGVPGAVDATAVDGGADATPGSRDDAGAPGDAGPGGDAGGPISTLFGIAASPAPVNLAGLTGEQVNMVSNGSYIVNALADCDGCHTIEPSKFLAGGIPFAGRGYMVSARNLTPDPKTGMKLTLQEFVAAMRTGADFADAHGGPATTTLTTMPWQSYRWMTQYDLESIWWYLKAIPGIANAIVADDKTALNLPAPAPQPTRFTDGDHAAPPPLPPEITPRGSAGVYAGGNADLGSLLRGLSIVPFESVHPPPSSDPTHWSAFARGSYIVTAAAACGRCHTNTENLPATLRSSAVFLTGGSVFPAPEPIQGFVGVVRAVSANLLGAANGFFTKPSMSYPTFLTVMVAGIHAEDAIPGPVAWPMPWLTFRNMSNADLESVYVFLSDVAAQHPTRGSVTNPEGLMIDADKDLAHTAVYCNAGGIPPAQCPGNAACSATAGPGECLPTTCTSDHDCSVCQTCTAGSCRPLTGPPLFACQAAGF